ncbi:MAG: glycosyltransferase, partial [Fidelibacterota bacterium]
MIAFFITNLLMSYSIIIPIHNEEKQIPFLLKNITPLSINHEIIIIDDGSTDESLVHLERC